MAVNWVPLHSHLPLSVSPSTPNSCLPHIAACPQEATRYEPASIYPEFGMFGRKHHSSLWHPYIERVLNVLVELLPQASSSGSCLSLDSVHETTLHEIAPLPRVLKVLTSWFSLIVSSISPGVIQECCVHNIRGFIDSTNLIGLLHQQWWIPISYKFKLNKHYNKFYTL